MKTFRALHKKSFYKSESAWLKAVYKHNKSVIDATLDTGKANNYGAFKRLVTEMKSDRYLNQKYDGRVTTSRAVRGLARSEIFTSVRERITENALKKLKSDKEHFTEFRKKVGWKTKIKPEDFEWSKSANAYIYRSDDEDKSSYMISFSSKSPVRLSITEL